MWKWAKEWKIKEMWIYLKSTNRATFRLNLYLLWDTRAIVQGYKNPFEAGWVHIFRMVEFIYHSGDVSWRLGPFMDESPDNWDLDVWNLWDLLEAAELYGPSSLKPSLICSFQPTFLAFHSFSKVPDSWAGGLLRRADYLSPAEVKIPPILQM